MNSPMLPIQGPLGPRLTGGAVTIAGDVDDFLAELSLTGQTPPFAVLRGGPPPEVLEQIAAAGAIERRLRSEGRRVRFTPAQPGGSTRIEIHDREGSVRSLSVAEACELAAGRPLD